jgi:hypothetical protein
VRESGGVAHRRTDLERVLASSSGTLRHLAWLLTGDPERASALLRAALVTTYVRPAGVTEAERVELARDALIRGYVGSESASGATGLGLPVEMTAREWACAVLVHAAGVPERVAARSAGHSHAVATAAADRTVAYAGRLRDAQPPPQVWWPTADEVVAAAQPALAARRTRRRRVAALVLAVAVALGAVGVVAERASRVDVADVTLILNPPPSGGYRWRSAFVETSSGRIELMSVRLSGAAINVQLPGTPSSAAQATVEAPGGHGLIRSQVRGMPFYVVRGAVERARVTFGPTVADESDRSVRVLRVGAWSILWPDQAGLARTTREPVGVLWRLPDGAQRAAVVGGTYPPTRRMVVGLPHRAGLLMSDDVSVMVLTWDRVAEVPIHHGHALIPRGTTRVPLPYLGVGFGPATRATGPSGMKIDLHRDPDGSPLFTVSPRPATSEEPLPELIPVTVYDGARVVGRVTLTSGQ